MAVPTEKRTTPIEWLPADQEAAADYERYYSQADRKQMAAGDFAGPHRSFPILTQADVHNAARLIGHADDPAAVKAAIIAKAKAKGFALPKAWQKSGDGKEASESTPMPLPASAASPAPASAPVSKDRIATIKVCWIEDDAISLNGRQYPREAVDKLIASGQRALVDPNATKLTCFINHASADADETTKIAGRPTAIWREGRKGFALIDVPDTHTGRDIAKLTVGGYLNTVSLRATGAEMRTDRNKGLAQVGGDNLALAGIDFTTNPGLSQVARIQQVILEAAELAGICEVFDLAEPPIVEEYYPMPREQKLTEDLGLPHLVDGDPLPGTDGTQTADTYQQRMYEKPPLVNSSPFSDGSGSKPPMMEAYESAMREAHDHAAIMQGRSCAPGKESARYAAAMMTEAGRALSKANDGHLDAIHDKMANHLGMSCEGAKSKQPAMAPLEPDNDMDGESGPRGATNGLLETRGASMTTYPQKSGGVPATKETSRMSMNPQELIRALQEQGYKIEAPKTQAQILQERMDAQAQQFNAQLAELKTLILESRERPAQQPTPSAAPAAAPVQEQQQPQSAPPQRRSLVEGSNLEERRTPRGGPGRYRNGDYLRERYNEIEFDRLVDRSHPLPEGIDLERLINEVGQVLCLKVEEKYLTV